MVVDLAESRGKIDQIDREITKLFEERMKIANDVAAYKRSTGKPVYDAQREEEKLKTLREYAKNEFNQMAVEDLFRQIMSISRKYQYQKLSSEFYEHPFQELDSLDVNEDTRVVYFGEKGAFTEQAMTEYFGSKITAFHRSTFREVVETVANKEARYGVLPIENTSTGNIMDIYDLLAQYEVKIVAEHVIHIEQSLLARPGARLSQIKKVYSHPQGLMQCAPFLEEHGMEGIKYDSTAAAAKKVAGEDDMSQAAIASIRAAEVFGLDILEKNINFQNENYTRFIVISNQKVFLKGAHKISLCFELKHEAGSLYHMLSNFYYNGLNLTEIVSRPIPGRSFEYRFFVDIEGNLNDSSVVNAMETIRESAKNLRILGNY